MQRRAEARPVLEALKRHGIDDVDTVLFDTWAYGGLLVPEQHRDRRVGWTDVGPQLRGRIHT